MVDEVTNDNISGDPAVPNLKLITTTTGVRVSQACDRCRIKKIKCNGLTPCSNCQKIDFECKTSDRLTRRAFPKGYTENLEKKLKELEAENNKLKHRIQHLGKGGDTETSEKTQENGDGKIVTTQTSNHSVQINNPIDQIFNLDDKGIIIGNDNLNFESQFNHFLINLSLPFLKITNSHNYLLNDPNSYLYNPSYVNYIQFHNRDLDVIYNPLTGNTNNGSEDVGLPNGQLPFDIYDLFIKLINNFKKLFNNKKELDNQITQYFLNYNVIIPIFDYKQFMKSYDAFHTMYPFMFTYDDATINGFNLSSNDYQIVNEYLMTVIQIYAMLMMNDPAINLNLLLNNNNINYSFSKKGKSEESADKLVRSLYDFLPYFNVFHISVPQLQTYLLFLYYSLVTNNKEKSLILSSLINSFIGILGINLNSKNLFFNDLSLSSQQKRNRVMVFWVFKVLLKCFNLKFGFKPSLNTTVINPVTIERYFQLTPEKLSTLLDPSDSDSLFQVLLSPSVEFLNLVNIIIPSSFSPNYYQYLKNGNSNNQNPHKKHHPKHLDWILNDDDGDGNDGNLNYNFTQFSTIDENLANWRESLKSKNFDLEPLQRDMNLPVIDGFTTDNLYHDLSGSSVSSGMTHDGLLYYYKNGVPDAHSSMQLVKIQLNFHYLLIRSANYLNFVIDKELTYNYYLKISEISNEVLNYFILTFEHVAESTEIVQSKKLSNVIMESLGLDVDEDGFVINDFSVKRRKTGGSNGSASQKKVKEVPISPFNFMLNGLSMTIINFKKSIILQMLYQLICLLKFVKRKEVDLVKNFVGVLQRSIALFINIFINYQNSKTNKGGTKYREDMLFKKLLNDELKDEILRDYDDSEDEDEDEDERYARFGDIDWDDEDMNEDIKYLKILKFIQYKSTNILNSIPVTTPTSDGSQSINQNYVSKNKAMQSPMPNGGTSSYSSANSPTNFAMHKVPSMTKFGFMLSEDGMTSPFADPYAKLSQDDMMKREKVVANDLLNLKRASSNSRLSNSQWAFGANDS